MINFLSLHNRMKMRFQAVLYVCILLYFCFGTISLQTIYVNAFVHQTITINCTLQGSITWKGPPNMSVYSWKKKLNPPGIPENMRNRVNITGDFDHGHYNLQIKDVQPSDAGKYACVDQKGLRQLYNFSVKDRFTTTSTQTTTQKTSIPTTLTSTQRETTDSKSTAVPRPSVTSPPTEIIIATASSACVVIALMIIFVICLKKRKSVVLQQLMYSFKKYEDDDSKTYDAFVSFKSEERDTEFVFNELYPHLEIDLGFKLCIHQKDFVPGKAIRNNIVDTIIDSRRTIMVITQDYLQEGYTTFEYEVAHHEMLTSKHMIIPILLDPIEKLAINMDDTIKHILKSVTYIEWQKTNNKKAAKKFWKRLELSMPKKPKRVQTDIERSAVFRTL